MTAEFVALFKAEHPCPACPKMPLALSLRPGRQKRDPQPVKPGRHFCAYHLEVAKLAVRKLEAKRRKLGLCINCSIHAPGRTARVVPGTGRCKRHRLANLRRVNAWMAVHGEEHRARMRANERAYLEAGRCRCAGHPLLQPGFTRCEPCRLRQRQYAK